MVDHGQSMVPGISSSKLVMELFSQVSESVSVSTSNLFCKIVSLTSRKRSRFLRERTFKCPILRLALLLQLCCLKVEGPGLRLISPLVCRRIS